MTLPRSLAWAMPFSLSGVEFIWELAVLKELEHGCIEEEKFFLSHAGGSKPHKKMVDH